MDRLEAIRQHCEGGGPIRRIDMKYLLSEVDRLNKVLPGYAESARVIALYFSKFCDRSLPYSEMIADAARKADAEITTLTARAEKAEAENRWISVGERLPDVTEYRNGDRYKSMDSNELVPFLVCCEDTEIPFRAFYDGKSWGDGWGKQNVTHWMPLPEPPKGE